MAKKHFYLVFIANILKIKILHQPIEPGGIVRSKARLVNTVLVQDHHVVFVKTSTLIRIVYGYPEIRTPIFGLVAGFYEELIAHDDGRKVCFVRP